MSGQCRADRELEKTLNNHIIALNHRTIPQNIISFSRYEHCLNDHMEFRRVSDKQRYLFSSSILHEPCIVFCPLFAGIQQQKSLLQSAQKVSIHL